MPLDRGTRFANICPDPDNLMGFTHPIIRAFTDELGIDSFVSCGDVGAEPERQVRTPQTNAT
jgi:hypothetical protein